MRIFLFMVCFISVHVFAGSNQLQTSEFETVVLGPLDPDDIRKSLLANLDSFKKCYEKELEKASDKILEGIVRAEFVIYRDGTVKQAEITSKIQLPQDLNKCLTKTLSSIRFSTFLDSEFDTVEVKQPFNFYPKKQEPTYYEWKEAYDKEENRSPKISGKTYEIVSAVTTDPELSIHKIRIKEKNGFEETITCKMPLDAWKDGMEKVKVISTRTNIEGNSLATFNCVKADQP